MRSETSGGVYPVDKRIVAAEIQKTLINIVL